MKGQQMGVYRYGICGRESTAHGDGFKFKFSYTDILHKCTPFEDEDMVERVCNRAEALFHKRTIDGRVPYVVEHKPTDRYRSVVWKNFGAMFYYEAFSEDPRGIEAGDYGFPCGYIKAEKGRWKFVEDRAAFDKFGRFKEGTYDDRGDKSWFTPWNEDPLYKPDESHKPRAA